jgi:hypothetical protein
VANGYDLNLDTNNKKRDWLCNKNKQLIISYPDDQEWGAIFITKGKPVQEIEKRETIDIKHIKSLVITMRGEKGGEKVCIGIKDNEDPDDGREKKIERELTSEYHEYRFNLSDFHTADLKKVYVATEFVFGKNSPCRIFVKSVKFK